MMIDDDTAAPVTEDATELTFDQRRGLRSIARPLHLIFWGLVLVALDVEFALRVGDRSAGLDILPDGIGYGLVAVGVGLLAFGGLFEGADDIAITVSGAVACGGWQTTRSPRRGGGPGRCEREVPGTFHLRDSRNMAAVSVTT